MARRATLVVLVAVAASIAHAQQPEAGGSFPIEVEGFRFGWTIAEDAAACRGRAFDWIPLGHICDMGGMGGALVQLTDLDERGIAHTIIVHSASSAASDVESTFALTLEELTRQYGAPTPLRGAPTELEWRLHGGTILLSRAYMGGDQVSVEVMYGIIDER